jgi:hypothetical protein
MIEELTCVSSFEFKHVVGMKSFVTYFAFMYFSLLSLFCVLDKCEGRCSVYLSVFFVGLEYPETLNS